MSIQEDPQTLESPASESPEAAKAVALIREAMALLALTPKVRTAKQKRHGLKFRKGVEPSIRAVARLAQTHGVAVPGSPTDTMVAMLAHAAGLEPVRMALVSALSLVDETIFDEKGTAYGTALTLYGMLRKVGHRHAEISETLAPVETFFSYRTPKVAAERAKKRAAARGAAKTEASDDPERRATETGASPPVG